VNAWSAEHWPNAIAPMDVTDAGMVMDVSLLQLTKALSPMDSTPLPRFTEVNPLHDWNARAPMDVTVSGMVSDVILVQLAKA
jgi:hypothetical protein